MERMCRPLYRMIISGRVFLYRILRTLSVNYCPAKGINKLIALVLLLAILSTSTPAAPQILSAFAGESRVSSWLWWHSSSISSLLQRENRPSYRPQEEQNKRDAKVARIEIHPDDIAINAGQRVFLSAIAYDADNSPIGGVKFNWSVTPERKARITSHGDFLAGEKGKYEVTVRGAGVQANRTISVAAALPRRRNEQPAIKEVDSRRRPANNSSENNAQSKSNSIRTAFTKAVYRENSNKEKGIKASLLNSGSKSASSAAVAAPMFFQGGNNFYNDSDAWSAHDPINRVGSPLGAPLDHGAGSSDFTFSAPIMALAGRGVSTNLVLNYNSRLWNKAGTEMTYNIDQGWPAPGFLLGFGKMLLMGDTSGSMLVEADGTHHSYTGTISQFSSVQYFNGKTSDGSFIDYTVTSNVVSGHAVPSFATAYWPNGLTVQYSCYGSGGLYPTEIRDANGNFINITYQSNGGPQIDTIKDTLGRVITFSYDTSNRLTSISAPPLGGTGPSRVIVQLHYQNSMFSVSNSFPGMTVRGATSYWLPDAIYYPPTNTGYWFGDSDSYSQYGMLVKVSERSGMGVNPDGSINPGTMTRELTYNYPLDTTSSDTCGTTNPPGCRTAGASLSDAPTYTRMTETWAGSTSGSTATIYSVQANASPRKSIVTSPDGSISVQYSYNNPGVWNDGVVYQDDLIDGTVTGQPTLNSSSIVWEEGDYNSPRPHSFQMTDERGQSKLTSFEYGPHYNQVTGRFEYDYDGVTVLKTTRRNYIPYSGSSLYIGLHIFNLVTAEAIYNGYSTSTDFTTSDSQRIALTETQYDGGTNFSTTLAPASGVVQYDPTYDPYNTDGYWLPGNCYPICDENGCHLYCDPDTWVPYYNSWTVARGNVTQLTRYADPANHAGPNQDTRTYDITGNMIIAISSSEKISVEYTSGTQYTYPTKITRGSPSNTTAQVTTQTTYDFNTGLRSQSTDMNGRITQMEYYFDSLRAKKVTSPTGAYTNYNYDDSALTATITSLASDGLTIAGKNVKYLTGIGQVAKEQALSHENGTDYWDVVEARYDGMGQVVQQSRPYRNGQTPQWTTTTYDKLGRETSVTAPDGSQSQRFYNETSYPSIATSGVAGLTERVVDPWGRERWSRTDALGRRVEVVEPDPNGTGTVASNGLLTRYSYDVLGQLTGVTQGDQQRNFRYDGLGRLTGEKTAEADATLNDAGAYVGSGQWSSVSTYDERSNLITRTDARGVVTCFSYYNTTLGVSDPLSRVQSITYDTSGVPSGLIASIPSAATVSYQYMTTGDVTRLLSVTDGDGTESYTYDSEGRVSGNTRTFSSRTSYPLTTSYLYDSLNRLTDITYPAQYGVISTPRNVAHRDYDSASRPTNLLVDSVSHASQIAYNADSRLLSLNVGGTTNQLSESYTYDGATGLLTNQKVQRSGTTTPLLDLSYQYLRIGTTSGRTGQLTTISNNNDHNKDRGFAYDMLGRLKQATGGPSGSLSTQTYSYDRYGNRTSVTATGTASNGSAIPRDGVASLAYTNGSGQVLTNRITAAGYLYDPNGSQTQATMADGSTQQYRYDAAGRLVQVLDGTGATLGSYTYGAVNHRLTAVENGQRTYYSWEGDSVVAEYTEPNAGSTPTWSKSYFYLGGRLLSTIDSTGTQYYHPDRLGTRLTTNAQNSTVTEQTTLPFGSALDAESSGTPTNRRFTSYDRSTATKLDNAVNRSYNSEQGRFTQADPIGMTSSNLMNPQSLNLYTYCWNDPVNHTDPNGLFLKGLWNFFKKIFKWIGVVLMVAVAVLAIVYAPSLADMTLKALLEIISAVSNAASAVLNALGLKTAASVFGIIAAGAALGTSLGALKEALNEAKSVATKLDNAVAKFALQAIGDGATLASRILTATGHKIAGQWLSLVNTVTSFVSNGFMSKGNAWDESADFAFRPTNWSIYEFARSSAEQIATLAGKTKLAEFLNAAGIVDDWHDMRQMITEIPTRPGGGGRLDDAMLFNDEVAKMNSIFDRVDKAWTFAHAPAHH